VVPSQEALKAEILHEAHDSAYAGHFGFHKTLKLITRHYWWPHIKESVATYIKGCVSCQANKSAHSLPHGKLQPLPIPDGKWHTVTVDFVTHLPETATGYTAICVFCDKLTKMVHLVPSHDQATAHQTAHMFLQHVWRLHGLPARVISDRGTQFDSALFREIMQALQVTQAMSSAYHPETDGQTERVNRVMQEVLRHYVNPLQTDWDQWLPCVEFAINNSVHSGTKETPFFLNYGIHPSTPLSMQTPAQRAARSRLPAAVKFTADMTAALDRAKRCLQAAQDRMKAQADRKRTDLQFSVGDQVWLDSKNIAVQHTGSRKLMPRRLGPFKVASRIGAVAYKLELPPTMKRLHPVFHVSLLTPYVDGGRAQPPPPPVLLADDDLDFEVEAVIGHKYVGRSNKLQYLIKFKGYGHEHNEWLPVSHLSCPELLEEYLASPAYQRSAVKITQRAAKKAVKQAPQAAKPKPAAAPARARPAPLRRSRRTRR
jgi:hypothetical protein